MGALAACFLVTLTVLGTLAHLVATDPKPVQILHAPGVLLADQSLGFMVRLQPVESDRMLYAILCNRDMDTPCSMDEMQHERLSQLPIEGDRAAKLWHPKPWEHMGAGHYTLIVTIGSVDSIRAQDARSVLVQGWP